MRMTLRDYFNSARRVHQISDDGDLLDKMSPLLQSTVALAANKKWLDHVWFFRNVEELDGGSDFIAALAKSLITRSFVSHERLPIGQLYVLRAGLVVKMVCPTTLPLISAASICCLSLCCFSLLLTLNA